MPSFDLPEQPPIGNLRFYNNKIPALKDGRYDIVVQQQLEFTHGDGQKPEFSHHQQFLVHGARFALDATALHAVYPPGGSQGNYQNKLAHIVLTKPALPWERSLDKSTDSPDGIPWMALLLFEEEEILAAAENPSPTRSVVYPIQEILSPSENNIFRPKLTLDPIERAQADPGATTQNPLKAVAIDIKTETFNKLVPAFEELPYLAHVRQVNPLDKEYRAETTDGWFAVLIGNRLIKADPAKETVQIAHLVSLEGFREYLPHADGSESKQFDSCDTVRLVSLAGWRFSAQPDRGDFGALMENMNCDLMRFPTHEEPCPPPHQDKKKADPASAEDSQDPGAQFDAGQVVSAALTQGYVALNYGPTRLGEHTVAWYRGPFTPLIIERAKLPAFLNAESAMIYDERTGLFDLSYAVAWQIGRLLALSDRQFGVNLLQWQRQYHRMLDNLQTRRKLYRRYKDILNFPADIDKMLAGSLMRPSFYNFFVDRLSARIEPKKRGAAPLFTAGDPSGLMKSLAKLPGVMSPAAVEAILETQQDPLRQLFQKVFDDTQ